MSDIPFVDLPSGCAKPVYNPANFVPPNFTLCTVPNLTDPTFAPTPFHIDIVGDLPPPYCPCIPEVDLVGAYDVDKTDQVKQISVSMGQKFKEGEPKDCCDPQTLEWYFSISVPCLPLSVKNKVKIRPWTATGITDGARASHSTFHIRSLGLVFAKDVSCDIRLSKVKNTCELALLYKLVIPCMPFDISVFGSDSNDGWMVPITQGVKALSMFMVKSETTCAWKLNYKVWRS